MGMPPMKDYVKNWDAGKYKKQLPEIEKLAREQVVK
ncbi:hypothetical protein SAMN05192573_104469 [Mucilaginibacter gossypii]|nr:hypothetical protein SAMN05192573_104469 [Mucilaginibacter gossypii]